MYNVVLKIGVPQNYPSPPQFKPLIDSLLRVVIFALAHVIRVIYVVLKSNLIFICKLASELSKFVYRVYKNSFPRL